MKRATQRAGFTGLLVLALVGSARAAETVAVVSLKPTDKLFADIEYLTKATGTQPFAQFFLPQIKSFFQGVNGQQPIGIAVKLEGGAVEPLGFIPVTDMDAVFAQIEPQLGARNDLGNGVYELRGMQTIYLKEQQGWAFIARSAEALSDLPQAPEQLLEGLADRYDIAVRAFVRDIPPQYKEMAVQQMRGGLEGQLDPDDPAARESAMAQVAQLEQLVTETDTLTIGWQIDPEQQEVNFDFLVQALPDTKMQRQIESTRNMSTKYAGFLVEGAALRMNLVSVFLPEQIQEGIVSLDGLETRTMRQIDQEDDLDDATQAGAKDLVGVFFDIVRSTVKTGRMDACASVILKPKSMTLVSATHVASGEEVESAVQKLVALSKNEPDLAFSNVKFNAEKHGGVRLHTMELPIPEDEYVRKVLGETLKVVVGADDTSAYVAIGDDALSSLKSLVDASKQSGEATAEPFEMVATLTPMLEFAQSVEPNPIINALSQMVANQKGKDHIRIRTSVVDDGAAYRVTLEEGALQLLGQGIQFVGMRQGGGF